MREIRVADVIDKENDQSINFHSGASSVIQMPVEYIDKVTDLAFKDVHILKNTVPVYERLTVKDHVRFYKKWYKSNLGAADMIRQYKLESVSHTRLAQCTPETIQRLAYIQAMLADREAVLAINPLYNAGIENIRLFHKMMEQMVHAGKGLVVITSSTEEAFVISSRIARLSEQGLKEVETEMPEERNSQTSLKRIKAKAQDKTIFIDLEDIEYIESNDGKVYINISREKFIVEWTLAETEKKLAGYGFYRCHRSYIVNLGKVREIITWSKNTYSIVMENQEKTKIPLSRMKYSEIQELLVV